MSITQRYQEKMKAIKDAQRLDGLHSSRVSAKVFKESSEFTTLGTTYQTLALYNASLEDDLKRLKDLSTEQKSQLKSNELIDKYKPVVEGVLKSGRKINSPVAGWVLIWMMDCAQFDDALPLAKELLAIGQELPVKRDIPTFMADAFKEWAAAEINADNSINPYITDFLALVETDEAWTIHDKSRAELYKLLGFQAYKKADWQNAVEFYTKAQDLDEAVGVKTKLAEAEKALAKQAQA